MCLIINLAGIDEGLKAAKDIDGRVWELHNELNLIVATILREVFAVVRGLSAEKVLLYAEGNLIRTDEDNNEERVCLTNGCQYIDVISNIGYVQGNECAQFQLTATKPCLKLHLPQQ